MDNHVIIGCFRDYSYRANQLLLDLQEEFGNHAEIIVSQFSQAEAGRLPAKILDNETLLAGLAEEVKVDVEILYEAIKRRTLLRKFLLALYTRKVLKRDYCIVVEDDLVVLEHIPELVELSRTRTPFILATADGWTKEDEEEEPDRIPSGPGRPSMAVYPASGRAVVTTRG